MNFWPFNKHREPRAVIVTRGTSKAQREQKEKQAALHAKLAAENARNVPGRVG